MRNFLHNNFWLIVASIFFISYQVLLSIILWNRNGDIPPGFGDSLSYIWGIDKIIQSKQLFPYVPYLSLSGHLSYFSYNVILGILGIVINTNGEQIFYFSFFIGKILLVITLFYFLKRLFPKNNKLIAFCLLGLSVFAGDGSTHGFFWVVPSFWMILIFFVILGITYSNKKISYPPLLLLSFIYVSIHPISSYSILIFLIIFTLNIICRTPNPKNINIVLLNLTTATIIWQAINILTPLLSKYYYPVDISSSQINIFENYKSTNPIFAQEKPILSVTNTMPNITIKTTDYTINRSAASISKIAPGFTSSWNSYYSWFFRFPPLLFLLIASLYFALKHNKNLSFLFISCQIFSFSSQISPFGYRSLIFTVPITILLISYYIFCYVSNSKKLIMQLFIFGLGLTSFSLCFISNIISINYYSKIADYKSDIDQCIDYIKTQRPDSIKIYFTSVEGINLFLSKGLYKYNIIGLNGLPKGTSNNILISEKEFLKNDIQMPLTTTVKLDKIKEVSSCGLFKISTFDTPLL